MKFSVITFLALSASVPALALNEAHLGLRSAHARMHALRAREANALPKAEPFAGMKEFARRTVDGSGDTSSGSPGPPGPPGPIKTDPMRKYTGVGRLRRIDRVPDKSKDDSKTDDGKTDDGKTDDGKTDDGKTNDSKTDDGKTDGGKKKKKKKQNPN